MTEGGIAMLKGEQTRRELESKERVANADRQQRERESKRHAVASIIAKPIDTITKAFTKFNDASFYDGAIRVDKASFGLQVPTFAQSGNPTNGSNASMYQDELAGIPIVCSARYGRTVGSGTDAAGNKLTPAGTVGNQALARIISHMRTVTGRQIQYSPDELGLWFLAVDEIKSLIMRIGLMLQVSNSWKVENYLSVYPLLDALAGTTGFGESFVANKEIWIAIYQNSVRIFNANLPLPQEFGFVKRTSWLAGTVSRDNKTSKHQYYVWTPYQYMLLDVETSTLGSRSLSFSSGGENAARTLFGDIKAEIAKLTLDTSFVSMLADIRAAFDGFVQLDGSNEFISREYEPLQLDEVNEQFHNLNTPTICAQTTRSHVNAINSVTTYEIQSTGDYLVNNIEMEVSPTLTFSALAPLQLALARYSCSRTSVTSKKEGVNGYTVNTKYKVPRRLNFYHDDISQNDMITATRGVALWDYYVNDFAAISFPWTGKIKAQPAVCGSEVVFWLEVYGWGDSLKDEDKGLVPLVNRFATDSVSVTNTSESNSMVAPYYDGMLYAFDWIPITYFIGPTSGSASDIHAQSYFSSGEWANYFFYPNQNLQVMHDACVYGEFMYYGKFKSSN